MIPHNMPLFKFTCELYQFHHQTLPIMKIDRGQIQFRDYVFTGTEPKKFKLCHAQSMVSCITTDSILCMAPFEITPAFAGTDENGENWYMRNYNQFTVTFWGCVKEMFNNI